MITGGEPAHLAVVTEVSKNHMPIYYLYWKIVLRAYAQISSNSSDVIRIEMSLLSIVILKPQ